MTDDVTINWWEERGKRIFIDFKPDGPRRRSPPRTPSGRPDRGGVRALTWDELDSADSRTSTVTSLPSGLPRSATRGPRSTRSSRAGWTEAWRCTPRTSASWHLEVRGRRDALSRIIPRCPANRAGPTSRMPAETGSRKGSAEGPESKNLTYGDQSSGVQLVTFQLQSGPIRQILPTQPVGLDSVH